MLPYINELSQEEQEKLQEMIRRLFRQTFLLERKYDKKAGRMVADKDFYFADRHMDFLKDYFAAAGICLEQNTELGTIYLTGETDVYKRQVFVLELLVYIRPVFLYGKKEKGSYGFAGILFVGKKEDLWQITLYKSRYDSYKTGEFRLQCGLWGYFHEGEPLMISLENLIFKKFEVSGKLDFRL